MEPIFDPALFGASLSALQLGIALLAALAAGFLDSIAGGGGIITVPVLLGIGLPPHLALGTNKLQASFGSFTASFRYVRGGLVDPRTMVAGILWTLIGAVAGSLSILALRAEALQWGIPFLLLGIFIYILLSPVPEESREAKMSARLFYLVFGLAIGFYDGFIGPGTGSFWTIAFLALRGLSMKQATGHTKVLNFTSNLVSLLVFAFSGSIALVLGMLMGICQVVGAWIGSHVVLKRSSRLIRAIFLIVVAMTILNLIRQNLGISLAF